MTTHFSDFWTYHPFEEPEFIYGTSVHALGQGSVRMYVPTSRGPKLVEVHNVLYIPDMAKQDGPVTRLFSQRASQNVKENDDDPPVYVCSKKEAYIQFKHFRIDLDIIINVTC